MARSLEVGTVCLLRVAARSSYICNMNKFLVIMVKSYLRKCPESEISMFAICTLKSGFWMLGDVFEVRSASTSIQFPDFGEDVAKIRNLCL